MSTLDSFDGLANKDFSITYYIVLGFVLLCVTPLLLQFTTNIQQIFGHVAEVIGCIYLATTHVFGTKGMLCGAKSSNYTLLDNDIQMGILTVNGHRCYNH